MISLVAVTTLSFFTLCFGTYLADRLEQRCTDCSQTLEGYDRRHRGQ